MKALRRLETDNAELRRVQEYVGDFVAPLVRNALLDGLLLEDVQLSAGTNAVTHGLGRSVRGFFAISPSVNAAVWKSSATNPSPAGVVMLEASASVTLSLWVF